MTTFVLILIGVIGILFGYSLCRNDVKERFFEFANEERPSQKERRKRMLMKHLQDRGQLTNEEARGLLGVSDSTIVSYFDELEEVGLVTQVGDTGSGVYYTLT